MTNAFPQTIQKGLHLAVKDGIQLLREPFCWESDYWVFEVSLALGLTDREIKTPFPSFTNWFMVIENAYPFGEISIYPSKNQGINGTFPHQSINLEGSDNCPWRTGKLCLDSPTTSFGIIGGNQDPVGNSEERIEWYLKRTLGWIQAAATNRLINKGDPFEVPSYSLSKEKLRLVHDESPMSFSLWNKINPGEWGYTILDNLPASEQSQSVVGFFRKSRGKPPRLIRSTSRFDVQKHTIKNPNSIKGVWWLWGEPIVLDPWQTPVTWQDLRTKGRTLGINVDHCLRGISKFMRENHSSTLIIGYPIPKINGDSPSEIYWKAISLPDLGKKQNKYVGFRPKEGGYWFKDRETIFGERKVINYLETENWHPDRTQARGRFPEPLRKSNIGIIGTGALGALLAEILVRGGTKELTFYDPDLLIMGNLVRHSLAGQDIGKFKAQALADRLLTVAPFSKITAKIISFPKDRTEVIKAVEEFDIVLDCTADDAVLLELSTGWWNTKKLFISASVGYRAKKTFLIAYYGHFFPANELLKALLPHIQEEKTSWAVEGETIEGAGCWSPLFPARLDDLFMSASTIIKVIEEIVEK
ncbi:MAG: ThiF family adenylyltransferase, partial [Anaerolineaceae bacterium]